MTEDKKRKHRNKPNRMSEAEIMVVLILFHSGGFRCFKHYYKEYVCKHLKHLFPRQVSYNRFVDSTPLRVCRNQRIRIHKTFEGITNGERPVFQYKNKKTVE